MARLSSSGTKVPYSGPSKWDKAAGTMAKYLKERDDLREATRLEKEREDRLFERQKELQEMNAEKAYAHALLQGGHFIPGSETDQNAMNIGGLWLVPAAKGMDQKKYLEIQKQAQSFANDSTKDMEEGEEKVKAWDLAYSKKMLDYVDKGLLSPNLLLESDLYGAKMHPDGQMDYIRAKTTPGYGTYDSDFGAYAFGKGDKRFTAWGTKEQVEASLKERGIRLNQVQHVGGKDFIEAPEGKQGGGLASWYRGSELKNVIGGGAQALGSLLSARGVLPQQSALPQQEAQVPWTLEDMNSYNPDLANLSNLTEMIGHSGQPPQTPWAGMPDYTPGRWLNQGGPRVK
jgi:hypothetical protein